MNNTNTSTFGSRAFATVAFGGTLGTPAPPPTFAAVTLDPWATTAVADPIAGAVALDPRATTEAP